MTLAFCVMAVLLLIAEIAHGQGADIPAAVVSDENGFVYVTGTSVNPSGQTSIVVVAYDTAGNLWHEFALPPEADGPAMATGIGLIDSLIVVAGTAPTLTGGADIIAAGFDRPDVVSVGATAVAVTGLSLEQSYPNPLRVGSVATIEYGIPVRGGVRLAVVDMGGREVAVLAEGFHEQGRYRTHFRPSSLPSGSYLYVLTSTTTSEVRRLTLIR